MHCLNHSFKTSLLFFCLFFTCVFGIENQTDLQARIQITTLLEKWADDFNSKNISKVCEIYAPELVASYPEIEDRNYEAICKNFAEVFKSTDETFRYEKPLVQQIMINGDLAVVRLLWTLKISYADGGEADTISEKGMDIFQKQKDGQWKIVISYAYPDIN